MSVAREWLFRIYNGLHLFLRLTQYHSGVDTFALAMTWDALRDVYCSFLGALLLQ